MIQTGAQLHPDAVTIGLLGARPEPGPGRTIWDHAAGEFAVHRTLHPEPTTPEARRARKDVAATIDRARHHLGVDTEQPLGVPSPVPTPELEQVPSPAQPTIRPMFPNMVLER